MRRCSGRRIPLSRRLRSKPRSRRTAVPVGAFGADAVGAGLVDALGAVGANPPAGPQVSISGPAITNDTTPSFEISVSGDAKTITCSVDGAAATSCGSPFTTAVLADGAHSLAVNATDFFAQSGSASTSVQVDSTAPKLKIRKGPKKKGFKRKAKFKFATDADATLTCKLDKRAFKPCSTKAKFKVRPGRHKLTVDATDALGNVAREVYRWRVKKRA